MAQVAEASHTGQVAFNPTFTEHACSVASTCASILAPAYADSQGLFTASTVHDTVLLLQVERMAIMQQQQPGAVIIQGQRTRYLLCSCLCLDGMLHARKACVHGFYIHTSGCGLCAWARALAAAKLGMPDSSAHTAHPFWWGGGRCMQDDPHLSTLVACTTLCILTCPDLTPVCHKSSCQTSPRHAPPLRSSPDLMRDISLPWPQAALHSQVPRATLNPKS